MPAGRALQTRWFDGRSPRGHAVRLQVQQGELLVEALDPPDPAPLPPGLPQRHRVDRLRWPERTRHGVRQLDLPDGSLLQHTDTAEWDDWCDAQGFQQGLAVRWALSWRATVSALMGVVLLVLAAWLWGVPWLGQVVAHRMPDAVDQRIGQSSLQQLDGLLLQPSRLPAPQQAALRERWAGFVQRAHPAGDAPAWQLHLRRSDLLGANALALPGGHIVVTDELVQRLDDQPAALLGVLAHELGHVQHRDGLDMIVRAGLVSALVGLVIGDASGFMATVPAALTTQAYSRAAERRADAHAAALLHANGYQPAVMVVFFERLRDSDAQGRTGGGDGSRPLPIAIASHPADAERIRFFRDWAPRP
jgi:Zn-dependent protease with chaperone function